MDEHRQPPFWFLPPRRGGRINPTPFRPTAKKWWGIKVGGRKGTLLFEAFVALMILSVGVTSTLKIFSEALFAGTRNEEKKEAISELDHLLFEWFAYPGGVVLPEDGVLTLPLDSERFEDLYSVEIRSQNLKAKPEELEAERKIRSFEASQYYQVKCRVDKEHRKGVFDLGACVFRARGR